MACILRNARCVTLFPPTITAPCDLKIVGGAIVERARHSVIEPGDEVSDVSGCYVMPGFVNAHTHLYSTLSRGMPPAKKTPENFQEILKAVWWKLDRALDEETIYYSALEGALEAVMCGTTSIVDHHASPGTITGSLDLIRKAMERIGMRGVLCYEVTDRGGRRKRDLGLEENERFIRGAAHDPMFRGLVGAHASFTLSDESLALCGRLAERLGVGVHIHAAEDASDVADAHARFGCGIMDRFAQHGIARNGSVFAHCIHLTAEEIGAAREAGCRLVHNPRSNMNNRVGYAPVHRFGDHGALGTDGFPSDMVEEAAIGFFKNSDACAPTASMMQLLDGGQRMLAAIFGRPFGTLTKGAPADLIVIDYQSPTPVTAENAAGHVLFGMRSSMVRSVMVEGRWIMRDRSMPGIDVGEIHARSQRAAKKLWERVNG